MASKSRTDLKALFDTGRKLTSDAFCDLIDSALVKRDDCFMGKWEAGVEYCNGSIVTHGKCFYMLVLPEMESECLPTSEGLPGNPFSSKNGTNGSASSSLGCICSTTPPSMDLKNWCKLATVCHPYQIIPEDENTDSLEPLAPVLEHLCELEPVKYSLKESHAFACDLEKNSFGLKLPSFMEDADGPLPDLQCLFDFSLNNKPTFDYVGMISVLVQAIKELKTKMSDLESRITELEGPGA